MWQRVALVSTGSSRRLLFTDKDLIKVEQDITDKRPGGKVDGGETIWKWSQWIGGEQSGLVRLSGVLVAGTDIKFPEPFRFLWCGRPIQTKLKAVSDSLRHCVIVLSQAPLCDPPRQSLCSFHIDGVIECHQRLQWSVCRCAANGTHVSIWSVEGCH